MVSKDVVVGSVVSDGIGVRHGPPTSYTQQANQSQSLDLAVGSIHGCAKTVCAHGGQMLAPRSIDQATTMIIRDDRSRTQQ